MIRLALAAAFAFALTAAAQAQQPDISPGVPPKALEPGEPDLAPPEPPQLAPPGPPQARGPEKPAARPRLSGPEAHAKAVDELLARLAKAEDPAAAKRIAAAVQALWTRSGSDTVDLLTSRSSEAQRSAKTEVAIKLMDEVVGLKPEFAEGWNRRATLHFLAKDYDQAMSDIRETLVREPRHFGAWIGLGRILRESGLDRQALGAYRKALALYPAVDGLKRDVDELTIKVEGQPI